MIRNVIVAGAGSAGLMMALALKRQFPQLAVRVIRSPEIGVIGVGESTTRQLPPFLFDYLGLDRRKFYATVQPTWKIGVRFLWGPRPHFDYPFQAQFDARWSHLSRPNGYYCDGEFDSVNLNTALMAQGKAFVAQPNNGGPVVADFGAFHLYNPYLVRGLEQFAVERGIEFLDAKITGVTLGEEGVRSLVIEDGRQFEADLFVDATGFRSELLGRALEVPFDSYADSLYCDRAIVGSWDRTDEFIYPYTVAETMEAGWCWRIDHEHAVNRGYVYSSRFISDDEARAEFAAKNPKAKTWDRPIQFRSGRFREGWVKNVIAIGNACGFVEPLEATALMVATSQIHTFVDMLFHCQLNPQPLMRKLYNEVFVDWWDGIRDFLAIHYRFNTRLDNEFWRTCRGEVNVSQSQPLLDFYRENGPTAMGRHLLNSTIGTDNQFGIDGFLTMLVGQKVPYNLHSPIADAERVAFRNQCRKYEEEARQKGLTVAEALWYVKHPNWRWHGE